MENEFLKMMPKEQILKAFDEMMDFVKSDSPTAIDYLREIRDRYAAQPDIVRCKECKHRPIMPDDHTNGFDLKFPDGKCPCQCDDGWYSWYPSDDWFCANGERAGNAR